MIEQRGFRVEPWAVRESGLDLDLLAQTESIFALSNGHIGLRGNLDEGEPHGLPGTYLNSVYELRPLPYAEAGYGYPESGQTVINVTNGKVIRLLVDDEPFDVRYGALREHERVLDLRAGVLRRRALWSAPSGRTVLVQSTRLVSLTQRSVAAIEYVVEPVDGPARVVVQSELVTNEALPPQSADPRAAAALERPLESEEARQWGNAAVLLHRTRASGLRVGAAMDHEVEGPADTSVDTVASADVARLTAVARLQPGERLRIVKYIAYGWSSQRTLPAVHDQVVAALSGARHTGFERLLAEQREFLDGFWERAIVEVDGDPEVEQAVRFALFHVLQAGARGERRPIAAKGLTGPGYDGHVFWDTETFVLPVLTSTLPRSTGDVLRWRHATLDMARERARTLGLTGAAFPWRTIRGQECSAYWPAGTAAFHVNADIADAVVRYVDATEDTDFEREVGVELLVETARLWCSLGYHDLRGAFRIDGVTGPDEYSAIGDNNVYTNLMAQRNLREAATACTRHEDVARRLGVDPAEMRAWRRAADAMVVPYDRRLRVHTQDEGFTSHERWDFEGTPSDHYPLLLHYPYFELYRRQVVKQADLILAMQLCPDAFSAEQKRRNVEYYEPLTVRDSSLSAGTQAVLAAEIGCLSLAYDYLAEAAFMDLHDLEHNTRDGLHMASLANAWTALVAGFGGLRTDAERIRFGPRTPPGVTRLRFRVCHRGRLLDVEVRPRSATYTLVSGAPVVIDHWDQAVSLSPGRPVRRRLPALPRVRRPQQPAGRAPAARDLHPGRSAGRRRQPRSETRARQSS